MHGSACPSTPARLRSSSGRLKSSIVIQCLAGKILPPLALGCSHLLGWPRLFYSAWDTRAARTKHSPGLRLAGRLVRRGFSSASGHPLVNEVLQWYRPPPVNTIERAVLLDVGCSDGEITRSLVQLPRVSLVIGLDVDQGIIAQAKAAAQASNEGRVEFLEGSAIDVDFFRRLSEGLRYLTCFTTLHWLKAPPHAQELAIVNFARVVQPGGQMFLVHFLGLDDTFMELEAGIAAKFLGLQVPVAAYVPVFARLPAAQRLAQFRGLFNAAGFAVEEIRIAEDRFPVAKDQFLQFLQGASARIKDVADEKRAAYLTEWREEILRQGKAVSRGDSYEFATKALVAALRKDQSAPAAFYDHLTNKCEEGVLRLENLEGFGN